jgi:hypothetical protein
MQLLAPEDLLSTLEEGKLPPIQNILEKIEQMKQQQMMMMQQQQQIGGM